MDGTITAQVAVLKGHLTSSAPLVGEVAIASGHEYYCGECEVTPKVEPQKLETKDKVMTDDVTVKAIPYYEVSNPQGGVTIIIGGDY